MEEGWRLDFVSMFIIEFSFEVVDVREFLLGRGLYELGLVV